MFFSLGYLCCFYAFRLFLAYGFWLMGCMRYSIEVFCILAATVIKQDYTFLTER